MAGVRREWCTGGGFRWQEVRKTIQLLCQRRVRTTQRCLVPHQPLRQPLLMPIVDVRQRLINSYRPGLQNGQMFSTPVALCMHIEQCVTAGQESRPKTCGLEQRCELTSAAVPCGLRGVAKNSSSMSQSAFSRAVSAAASSLRGQDTTMWCR